MCDKTVQALVFVLLATRTRLRTSGNNRPERGEKARGFRPSWQGNRKPGNSDSDIKGPKIDLPLDETEQALSI